MSHNFADAKGSPVSKFCLLFEIWPAIYLLIFYIIYQAAESSLVLLLISKNIVSMILRLKNKQMFQESVSRCMNIGCTLSTKRITYQFH